MALDPHDAIPAKKIGDVAYNVVFGLPWLAGAAWLEWDNYRTWWVSALLLSGFGFVATGFLRRKNTDLLIIGLLLLWLGLYIYALVVADSISLRVWLGVWLLDTFVLFGGALPKTVKTEDPAPRLEPQDRVPEAP
jgi:hypothetical protein